MNSEAASVEPAIDESPLIGIPEIEELFGVKRWTIDRWRNDGIFPPPVYLEGRESLMRWRKSAVLAFRETIALPNVARPLPRPRAKRNA